MSYRIFMYLADTGACGYYRTMLPAIHLRDELAASGIDLHISNKIDESDNYDAYIFNRIPNQLEFIAAIRAYNRGAKIVWDIDDDFVTVPEWSPLKSEFGPPALYCLEECLKMAHEITVSTQPLADAVATHWPALGGSGSDSGKVTVLENLVDVRTYSPDLRAREGNPDFVKILWTGTMTHHGPANPLDLYFHNGDLGPLYEVAEYVQETKGVMLVILGFMPDAFKSMKSIVHIPGVEKRHYEGTLSLIRPDIALMPLADLPFNRCKSAIKWMECSMAGAICIASDMPPFSDVIKNQFTGFVLDCNPKGWTDTIDFIMDYRGVSWVEKINENARRTILSEFSWNSDNRRRRDWRDFFLKLGSV